ncbi:MAG: 2-succinylbenzoate--CoA ligase [Chroococcidiopsis sp. SAG 2025]|uniref:2-succinylbenzoate--CoA ligase n=1 Tax=Chroococcidiopsis sp. SAG 2025 TaxID=171389 RepID=UPI002936EEDC|nr:2-succinylbenzoate--CoA ligase [Chroococcidiopsis sp. SAG 2025]MDV2994264.1 2-succinylbenzoate--CoA ligase [Chroococcidiopsis sp. SAG 2025]
MASLLEAIKESSDRHWLIGGDRDELVELAEQFYLEIIEQSSQHKLPKIILVESNPIRFLAGFIAACSVDCSVFLCNSFWGEGEWQQVFDIVQPDMIWGEVKSQKSKVKIEESGAVGASLANKLANGAINLDQNPLIQESEVFHVPRTTHSPLIMIPTGGSSGEIRFAIHTWDTLSASVRGFQTYFQIQQINSFCVLPLYHVSGLMQFMRSLTTGGKLAIVPFKTIESGIIPDLDPEDFFISLVPTQLQRLLQTPTLSDWLSRFQIVLLGGASAWQELLNQARDCGIRLAPTYGMTETASQIATLRPEDFLQGYNSCGRVLPHAQIKITNSKNEILNSNEIGTICIQAKSLALGYYPDLLDRVEIQVDDLGFIDDLGYLNIVGRNSHKIITGGENVYPCEVEAAIRSTQLVDDIAVIGLCDRVWGEVVTAIYVPKSPTVSAREIKAAIANSLAKFKIPKYWISAQKLPRNAQGKLSQKQLKAIAILTQENCDRDLSNLTIAETTGQSR